MIPRLVRLSFAGAVVLAAAGSAQAFTPAAPIHDAAGHGLLTPVHDMRGRGQHVAPRVVVVKPRVVRDGLCITHQPVTSVSCFDYLRARRFHAQQHFVHGAHEHGPGCGHTPRWAHRHNQRVFLGWF